MIRFASIVACSWMGLLPALAAAGEVSASVEETKSVVQKWVATQELIFKERRAWRQEREVLNARVDLVEREAGELERKLSESRAALAKARASDAETASETRRLAETSARLADEATSFERDIRTLHTMLPPPVKEKIEPLFRRIPQDGETTKVSVAERFQNVLGILNEIDKSSGEITLANEIRPLSDGVPSEVKTVYVGLAQAYFISARGEAGVGLPTPEGWLWKPANELSRDINVVIQVLQNKAKPQFVQLPVTIR